MGPFKIFNIGKANEAIAELEAKLATVTAENETIQANAKAVEESATALSSELADTKAKLKAADATIASTVADLEKAKTDLAAATAKLANPSEQIKQAAGLQAAAIVATVGFPAVPTAPSSAIGSVEKKVKRSEFDSMGSLKRYEFVKSGGTIED